MNRIDLVLAVVLALFALRGFQRGFSREIFALVGLVGGVAVASAMLAEAVPMLPPEVPEVARPTLAFLGIFLAVALAAKIAGLLVQRALGLVMLSPLDRGAGIFLGAAKGVALIAMAVFVIRAITPPKALERACGDSVLMPPLLALTDDGRAEVVVRSLPDPIPLPSPSAGH
ncbi:MAG: CvpA family protein [Proteobacteria bacterium]|nr:CvpA family protein [Pseudomonadota bacterium]